MPFGIPAAGIIMRVRRALSSCTPTLAAATIALALAGCADPPPRSLDPNVVTGLHTIALAVPSEPRVGYSLLSNSGLTAFALSMTTGKPADLNSQKAVADVEAHRKEFDLAMLQQNLHLGIDLQASLSRVLEADGYKTSVMRVDQDKKGDIVLDNVGDLDADAVLYALITGAGYSDGLDGGPFAPEAKVRVQLIDRKSKKILLERWYLYDAYASPEPQTIIAPGGGTVRATGEAAMFDMTVLRPAEAYRFASYNKVLSNPALAAAGLRAATPLISDDLGKIFEKGRTATP
jgi:hypothetical protein